MTPQDIELDILVEAGDWPDEASLEALAERAIDAVFEELGFAEQSATPPHPASAPLGHPFPVGERRSQASAPVLQDDIGGRASASKTTSPQRGEVAQAKRRAGEGALPIAPPSELSLVFTDDAHIKLLNAEWRGKDKPTNVLSFPAFPPVKAGARLPPMLGDVVLAFETVAREAELEGKPFDHHLSHLLVHGLLHLLGYDHETEGQAEEMEGLERRVLDRLAIDDPYA